MSTCLMPSTWPSAKSGQDNEGHLDKAGGATGTGGVGGSVHVGSPVLRGVRPGVATWAPAFLWPGHVTAWAMAARKRSSAAASTSMPMRPVARNCGQTMSIPAPR